MATVSDLVVDADSKTALRYTETMNEVWKEKKKKKKKKKENETKTEGMEICRGVVKVQAESWLGSKTASCAGRGRSSNRRRSSRSSRVVVAGEDR